MALVAGPDPGHALPVFGLATRLRAAGHVVQVLTGRGHERTAAAHGIKCAQLPLLAAAAQDADLGAALWQRAADMAPPLAAMLAPSRPDLIVADTLTRCGGFAAQLLGIPWVELVPHHVCDPDPALPPIGLGWRPDAPVRLRVLERAILRRQERSRALGDRHAAIAARSIGLRVVRPPVHRLVATLPSLEYRRPTWPVATTLIGPVAIDPQAPPLAPPVGTAPLVVVTDSTAGEVDAGLGALALEALADEPLRLVVTSAHLAPRRRASVVVGQGPHEPLLAVADLAVGHGGAGFVGKAARAGVPLVTLPLQGDQREAAARLAWQGTGRTVVRRRRSAARLRAAVRRHLADPVARQSAQHLAREAAALDARDPLAPIEPWLRVSS